MELQISYPIAPPITITQPFGGNGWWYRLNGIDIEGHNGLDILLVRGQKVFATHDGIVLKTVVDSKGGIGVDIRTLEKYDYKGKQVYFKTIYWHLLAWNVKVGQEVKQGDVIATGNSTGFSTGDHLHFGLKPLNDDFTNLEQGNGFYGAIDPLPYLPSNTMKYVIIGNDQFLVYEALKVAISIADEPELDWLRVNGLSGFPDSKSASYLSGYKIYSDREIAENTIALMKSKYNLK